MRYILFRGKDTSGAWQYGSLLQNLDNCYIVEKFNNTIFDSSGQIYINENSLWLIDDPRTFGQYTGMLDKNGNKIFEGDIVIGEEVDGKMAVMWDNFHVAFGLADYGNYQWEVIFPCTQFEIIGNIHDNPELLEAT